MTPLRRQIRWGLPKGAGFGVGDCFLFTPVCRQADVIWQLPYDSFCAADLAGIIQSVARVEYVHDPIKEDESLAEYGARYGLPSVRRSLVNAAQGYLHRYGLDIRDCIPEARPPAYEIEWAHRWLAGYRRPIVFVPVPNGLVANPTDPHRLTKWVPVDYWRPTLEMLSKNHDILYFNTKDNYIAFPHVHTLLGFSTSKIAAIQYLCKRHVGSENGMLHLAVAMGAECWCALPSLDINNQAYVPFLYADHLWNGKPNRVSYVSIIAPNKIVRNLTFSP